jgi:type VII secretion-associated serine protease mycosin
MQRRLARVATATATLAVGLAIAPTAAHADPALDKKQWWFDSWGIQKEVWPQSKGRGVTVAVIDSGVNASLPDLRGVVLPGTDVTGSGDGRKDLDTDENGHGTAMASLIASQGKGTGFMGVAPEAKILPIVDSAVSEESEAKAIRYAVDHGAKVINISQGGPGAAYPPINCPAGVLDAVSYADKKDVVVVASSGNTGDSMNAPEFPGSCPGVVAVGAIDHLARPWVKTQRQDYVTVAAPGAGMDNVRADGRVYTKVNGTSDSAALVSGAFALVRSKFPDMSARRAVQVVTNTTVDIGAKGKDKQTGFGAVSIRRALSQNVPESAPNPVYQRLDQALAKKGGGGGATSTAPKAAEEDDSGTSPLVYVGIGVVVLAVIGVVGFLLMRRRPSTPSGPPPGGPAFGPPPGPQQSPYQSGGTPPMGGGQQPPPQFQPPGPPRNE